jgi:hypothetical protein
MTRVDKGDVLASLTAEAVAAQYGIAGRWFGRWMRARRCPASEHGTDAFGLARDGAWHCHACDIGGRDLLSLVAACEGLDCATAFPEVLEVAAAIAGVEPEPDFGVATSAPLRKPRPPAPPVIPPLAERVCAATARAQWIWGHLKPIDPIERVIETGRHWYLDTRGIAWARLTAAARASVRELGFWTLPGEYEQLATLVGEATLTLKDRRVTRSIGRIFSSDAGVAIAVRHVETGNLVDVRARRAEVREGEPKIMGMPGGVTGEGGELVGCYGMPHLLDADVGIVVEGWADYLTACMVWPDADVLGAVDAGSYPLVAGRLARSLAERGRGRLVLVVQHDPDRVDQRTGMPVRGAAYVAADAAEKRALAMLGPGRVQRLACRDYLSGERGFDLNDIVRSGRIASLPELVKESR